LTCGEASLPMPLPHQRIAPASGQHIPEAGAERGHRANFPATARNDATARVDTRRPAKRMTAGHAPHGHRSSMINKAAGQSCACGQKTGEPGLPLSNHAILWRIAERETGKPIDIATGALRTGAPPLRAGGEPSELWPVLSLCCSLLKRLETDGRVSRMRPAVNQSREGG